MDKLGIISMVLCYAGFWLIPENPLPGIAILIISNLMWIYRGYIKRDWSVVLWQAGFVVINLRWLIIEKG
jgi:hypothetical protein